MHCVLHAADCPVLCRYSAVNSLRIAACLACKNDPHLLHAACSRSSPQSPARSSLCWHRLSRVSWSALKVYEFSIPTFGKGVVYDIDHKIRAEHFRFFGEALKTSKLKEYVPHFVKETEVGRELRCPQQSC